MFVYNVYEKPCANTLLRIIMTNIVTKFSEQNGFVKVDNGKCYEALQNSLFHVFVRLFGLGRAQNTIGYELCPPEKLTYRNVSDT